jgi:hypothetical protein
MGSPGEGTKRSVTNFDKTDDSNQFYVIGLPLKSKVIVYRQLF